MAAREKQPHPASKNRAVSHETGPKPLETCKFYNEKECRREKCNFLHICKNYIEEGSCHLGKDCPKSHDVLNSDVKAIMKKHGINTDGKPREIRDALRKAIRANKNKPDVLLPDKTREQQPHSASKNKVVSTETGPKPLETCKFYNECECQREKCNFLHLCKDYADGSCRKGQNCPKSHNVLDGEVIALLEKHGINTKAKAKEILENLRKAIKESKQSGESETKEIYRRSERTSTEKTGGIEQSSKTTERKPKEDQDESICYHHLKGKCRFKEKCINFHADIPYQWRYRLSLQKEWKPLPPDTNLTVEEKFSGPQNQSCEINLSDGERLKILFEYMIGSDGKNNRYDIQRLSTSSSVQYPNQPLTTEWQWYWKSDEGIWNKYESSDSTSTVTDIEQDYQANPEGQKILKTSNHEYVLDFQKMVQCNLKFGTKRDMTRRPVFVSKHDVDKKKELLREGPKKQAAPNMKIPSCWKVEPDVDFSDHYALVKVANDQEEYKKIEKYFLHTFQKNVSIKTIDRIENGELWDSYTSKRDKMSKKSLNKDVQERQLFHGTASSSIEVICKQGFDFRLSGQRVGAKYGRGSYFATTSKYSDCYADSVGSEKRMFVVKVLVGDYTQGEESFVRPPLKDPNDRCSPLYDSCVNNPDDPTIFVIFDICQVYPEYLITYNPGTN